jgi:hypothetical protein
MQGNTMLMVAFLASGLQLGAVEVFGNHSVTFRQSEFSLVDNNLLASVWTNSIKVARHTSYLARLLTTHS